MKRGPKTGKRGALRGDARGTGRWRAKPHHATVRLPCRVHTNRRPDLHESGERVRAGFERGEQHGTLLTRRAKHPKN